MATKYGTLEDGRPDIAEKLDVEKTGKTAKEISLKSGLKAWWKCKEGHSLKQSANSRTLYGSNIFPCFDK